MKNTHTHTHTHTNIGWRSCANFITYDRLFNGHRKLFFFFSRTSTFQLLDKPWSQVGVVPSSPRFFPSIYLLSQPEVYSVRCVIKLFTTTTTTAVRYTLHSVHPSVNSITLSNILKYKDYIHTRSIIVVPGMLWSFVPDTWVFLFPLRFAAL